jgi:hypothetical protein
VEFTNKIYIRLNEDNIVTYIFSTVFEQPLETDILLEEGNEEYHAHVHLKYKLTDDKGRLNYKYIDELIELTEEEKEILFPTPIPQQTETEVLQEKITELETNNTAFQTKDNMIQETMDIILTVILPSLQV